MITACGPVAWASAEGAAGYEPRRAAGDAAVGAVTRGVASLDALEELSGRS
ncbi:hypothetical protein [Streptomyces sp. SPB4]|uniref:hypothetical protein n=1 Tax=Streptomyces sp. SPB4 TaxID=2940553 RepID=UPI002476F59B|nr:hypothetical protein [Streptomyces sp. SPB4]MDH6544580.1 hypothetical protein [Streptomyces sp. SPB4]